MNRVTVKPEILFWARERTGRSLESLKKSFPKLDLWEKGELSPTLKQLEHYAKATRTPIGFFFLAKTPVEQIPIPDFRTMYQDRKTHPSPDLLDVIYICQQRQEWYREYARSVGERGCKFVASSNLMSDIEVTAANMRQMLRFDAEERQQLTSWTEALNRFSEQAENLGVLVMKSGIVGSNTRRKLDPQEFRGFALADNLAPLIFINSADSKSAQMFTLAHELAHLWLGESALSDVSLALAPSHEIEVWCNQVAAEFLVPFESLKIEYQKDADLTTETNRLARIYKVSTLVILRRIHDIGGLTWELFKKAYNEELKKFQGIPKASGGDFYRTQVARLGKRFARALIANTLEGQTLYRDAFRMLDLSKISTFHELGHFLGVQ